MCTEVFIKCAGEREDGVLASWVPPEHKLDGVKVRRRDCPSL